MHLFYFGGKNPIHFTLVWINVIKVSVMSGASSFYLEMLKLKLRHLDLWKAKLGSIWHLFDFRVRNQLADVRD